MSVISALIDLSSYLENVAFPLYLKLGALYLGPPLPLFCWIKLFPILHHSNYFYISPICVAISIAGFFGENLTYSLFNLAFCRFPVNYKYQFVFRLHQPY